ncbi:hypothetical protein ACFL4T_04755 [candidate division KSB1 bacterium]
MDGSENTIINHFDLENGTNSSVFSNCDFVEKTKNVYFLADNEITVYRINLETKKIEKILEFERLWEFYVSPDENDLLYLNFDEITRSVRYKINKFNIQTNEDVTVFQNDSLSCFYANWSPDSKKIAFSVDNVYTSDIKSFIMDRDGSNLKEIFIDKSLYPDTEIPDIIRYPEILIEKF